MAIREKTTITMRMTGESQSHSRTDLSVRGLAMVIDEPLERGGTNLGPSPTETFAASLIGCTNVISQKIAHKNGFELDVHTIRLDAQFDRRGVTLADDVAVPFPAMTLHIDAATNASAGQMDQLRTELAMYCPIARLVRASGTELTEIWNLTPLTTHT